MSDRRIKIILFNIFIFFSCDVNAQFGGGAKADTEQPKLAGFGQVPVQDQKVILPDSEVARFLP